MRASSLTPATVFPRLSRPETAAVALLVAMAFGLLDGALTVALDPSARGARALAASADTLWTAATAAAVVTLLVAGTFLLVDLVVPPLQARRLVIPVAAFLGVFQLAGGSRGPIGAIEGTVFAAVVALAIGRLLSRDGVRQRARFGRLSQQVAVAVGLLAIVAHVAPAPETASPRVATASGW